MSQVTMKPRYNTELFKNVFGDKNTFLTEWKASDFYTSGLVSDDNVKLTYALMYAKYGNNPIANLDLNQFKAKVWTIIFQYAPTWEKELYIQSELRKMTVGNAQATYDLSNGSKAIYNRAQHPGTTPGTGTLNELSYIDEQNTTNYKKSTIEGLSALDMMIKKDVTSEYIDKFKLLFKQLVQWENPTLYISEDEDD